MSWNQKTAPLKVVSLIICTLKSLLQRMNVILKHDACEKLEMSPADFYFRQMGRKTVNLQVV